MKIGHSADPCEGIVLSNPYRFAPVAATCPTSIGIMGLYVNEVVLFPPLTEAAFAYQQERELCLLFLKWSRTSTQDWVVKSQRIHTKFKDHPGLTMQLYPMNRIVEIRDGDYQYIASLNVLRASDAEERKRARENLRADFPHGTLVDLVKMLDFAISDRSRFAEQ